MIDPSLFIHLIRFYDDPDSTLRQTIHEGLRSLGSEEAEKFLGLADAEKFELVAALKATQIPITYIPKEPSQEALEIYKRAADKWNATDESKRDEAMIREDSAWMALAIKKANAPYPKAHSWLAHDLLVLGDYEAALHHAEIALLQDPNEFRAQSVKIGVLVERMKQQIELEHRLVIPPNFRNELMRLVNIYRNICQTNKDVEEFLELSEKMILLGHGFQDIEIPGGKPNLYAEVANAPIKNLDMKDKKQVVMDIQQKAKGFSDLFKP